MSPQDSAYRRQIAALAGQDVAPTAPRPLALVTDETHPAGGADDAAPLPGPASLAASQIAGARKLLRRDVAEAPRWLDPDLARMAGPLLPGDLIVVGARQANGKSTFLFSQAERWAADGVGVLYVPLEVDPEVMRLRWAAWHLGYSAKAVIRQEWHELPTGARDAVDAVLERQPAHLTFCPLARATLADLYEWCRWGVARAGARVVVLDHLHRMDFGADAAGMRVAVSESARAIKDMARRLGLPIVAAAQLNRPPNDPLDAFTAPQADRLRESAGIQDEADVILMLSRALRDPLPEKWADGLKTRRITERDLAVPGVMRVTCRKHRLDDTAMNASCDLIVKDGRVVAPSYAWNLDPRDV